MNLWNIKIGRDFKTEVSSQMLQLKQLTTAGTFDQTSDSLWLWVCKLPIDLSQKTNAFSSQSPDSTLSTSTPHTVRMQAFQLCFWNLRRGRRWSGLHLANFREVGGEIKLPPWMMIRARSWFCFSFCSKDFFQRLPLFNLLESAIESRETQTLLELYIYNYIFRMLSSHCKCYCIGQFLVPAHFQSL